MALITTYVDLFPSSTIMRQAPGNGTITIPGAGDARLITPNSLNCEFYAGDANGKPPLLYESLGNMWQMAQPGQPFFIETKLSVFTGTTSYRIAGLTLFTAIPGTGVPFYSYQFGWYKATGNLHVWYDYPYGEVEAVTSVAVTDPASTSHLYRIYWNPYNRPLYISELGITIQADTLCFAYSINAGVTWTSIGTRARDFSLNQAYAGLYLRKWETSAVSAQADFEYFRVSQYNEADQVLSPLVGKGNQETIGLEDQSTLLTTSGPTRFDYSDIGGDVTFTPPTTVAMEDQGGLLTQSGVSRFDLSEISEASIVPTDRMALEDGFQCHFDDSEFIKAKYDSDGKELVGYTSIRQILFYDATLDPWHAHGAGHYGAGRDGILYYDGVACGPGSFGTLTGGRRKTAWATNGDFVDVATAPLNAYIYNPAPTITADDEMQFALTTSQAAAGVSSRMRWFLTGDFDVQVDYEIVSSGAGPTDGGLYFFAIMDLNNIVFLRRHMWTTQYYDYQVKNNGSWGGYASVATSQTSSKLRITRVGSTVAAFYWTGSAWAQIGSNYTMTYARPMYIDCFLAPHGGTANVTVKVRNFTINSGATTNLIGWAREAAGTYRGSLAEFPQHALICSSGNGLDIIDADTQKLWMSFRGGTNNVVVGDGNYYIPQACMKDGVLFASYRTFDTAVLDGWAAWIDFTLDFMRLHRGPSYNDAGLIYNVELTTGIWPRDSSNGAISWRNSARGWTASHFDDWQFQHSRVNWCDLLHNGGFQYRAVANNGGTYLAKWQRWKFEGLTNAHLNTPTKGVSTKTTSMWWVLFDPITWDLFYHDRTKLYIVYFATWGSTMISGGTWVEDQEWTLAGNIDSNTAFKEAQDKMILYVGDLYYSRVQGIYKMNITTGVSTLFFGKLGSGATYEILPNYSTTVSIHQALDGVTPLMLIGLTYPDHVVAVNLLTNTLYWKGRMLSSPTPVALAVGL